MVAAFGILVVAILVTMMQLKMIQKRLKLLQSQDHADVTTKYDLMTVPLEFHS